MRILVAISLLVSSMAFAAAKDKPAKVDVIKKGGITFKGAAAASLKEMAGRIEGGLGALRVTRNKSNPNKVHIFGKDGDSADYASFQVKNNLRTKAFALGMKNLTN
jgi:hypothetical protein